MATALALALGACGGDDDEGANGGAAPEREAPTMTQEPTTTQEETPEEEPGEGEGDGSGDLPSGNANAGEQVFAENCSTCHGPTGGGAGAGPSLQNPELAEQRDEVLEQIINGGGGMPPFGDELSDQQIADVAAFVTETVSQR